MIKGIQWQNPNMDILYKSMGAGFMGSVKGIFHAIPLGLLLAVGGVFLAGAIYQFLKEVKVI